MTGVAARFTMPQEQRATVPLARRQPVRRLGMVASGDPGRTAPTPASGGRVSTPSDGEAMATIPHEHERPAQATGHPPVDTQRRTTPALDLLIDCGAHEIAHPGGVLLAHLQRVHALLEEWGARPAVRLAGLCHAYYGTDGFPRALGDVTRREELVDVIGEEAEQLVYFYASCDRTFSYPHLADDAPRFNDRFSGAVLHPPLRLCKDFAEMTAANELDIADVDRGFRTQHGRVLLALFTAWRGLLSDAALQAAHTSLAQT